MSIIQRIKSFFLPPKEDEFEYYYDESGEMPATEGKERDKGKAAIVVYEPDSYQDEKNDIINDVMRGKIAVINIRKLKIDDAQRLIDFLTGACYAIYGNIEKVQEHLFLFTPKKISVEAKINQ